MLHEDEGKRKAPLTARIDVHKVNLLALRLIGGKLYLSLTAAAFAIGIFVLLSTVQGGWASEELQTVDVQLGNQTYTLAYNITAGSVDLAAADSQQPYGGTLTLVLTSPAQGYLELTLPREFYDKIGFTDHPDLVAFVDGMDVYHEIIYQSCDRIVIRIPIEEGSEEIEIVVGDILGVHGHGYPPWLEVRKNITAAGQQFEVQMRTDSIKCDVSFLREEKRLHVDIESRNETVSQGYFSITIPRQLLGGNYTVLVDSEPAKDAQIFTTALGSLDGTDPNTSTISLHHNTTVKSIDIIGTSVIQEAWQTAHTLGRYGFEDLDLSEPDQIFKVHYRAINGTLESFGAPRGIGATVNSDGKGILEVKFPRNYPYTNEIGEVGIVDPVLFVNKQDTSFETEYVTTTDCFFVFSIPFTGRAEIDLAFSYLLWNEPFHGDKIADSCTPQTLVKDVPTREDGTISPLQQFKAGIAAKDVLCSHQAGQERQFLLMVSPDGKPYCVKLSHQGMMAAHGWSKV